MSNVEDQLKKLIEQHEEDSREIHALLTRNAELLAWSAHVVKIFVPENEDTKPNLEIMEKAVLNAVTAINEAKEFREKATEYVAAMFREKEAKEEAAPKVEQSHYLRLITDWRRGKKPHGMSLGEELVEMRKILSEALQMIISISELNPQKIMEEERAKYLTGARSEDPPMEHPPTPGDGH